MKLYLVRHPRPDVKKGLCYGHKDVSLLPGWELEAQALKQHLASCFSKQVPTMTPVFYHSPLSRAATLADYLSDGLSSSVEALKELDFGDWEGRCWQDIPRQEIDLWMEDIVSSAPYQGESLENLAKRLECWWLTIKDEPVDACVVVAHSGVIKVLVSLLCDWPLAQCHRIDVGFNSVSEFVIQGDFISLKRLGAGDWVA